MKKQLTLTLMTSILIFFSAVSFADYAIVVDAGSSGSRLHLFRYDDSTTIPIIKDVFSESTKPGLSFYAKNPQAAGRSLQKLFDDAKAFLEKEQIDLHHVTVNVFGTGGMRLLPSDTQQAIYTSVVSFIKFNYPFDMGSVRTITGRREGFYGWLDINYLQQNFQRYLPTSGSIDMGGASTQISFETNHTNNPNDEMEITIGGKSYHVFSKSFLGLGQDQARETITLNKMGYTCYPQNYPINKSLSGNYHFTVCRALYADLLQQHHIADAIILPEKNPSFVAYSGVYYAYHFLDTLNKLDQDDVENKIASVCTKSWDQLQAEYPDVPINYLSTYCANSTYISKLLYDTYQLQGAQLVVVSKINQQDIDWTLGALLYSLATAKQNSSQQTFIR